MLAGLFNYVIVGEVVEIAILAVFIHPLPMKIFIQAMLLAMVALSQQAVAQTRIADYTYGGSNQEVCAGIVPTSDGGFLVGGSTASVVSGEVTIAPRSTGNMYAPIDYWLFKIDAQGNKLWEKRYGGDGDDRLIKILPAAHGGYLLCGWSNSTISGDMTATLKGTQNYWVVRIDALGNKRWDKRYGSATSEQLSTALATPDGGFVLTGITGGPVKTPSGDRSQSIKGDADIWTIKLDSLGNKQWDSTLGSLEGDYVYGAASTPGGGIALLCLPFGGPGGDVSGPGRGNNDLWLVRLDAAGNKVSDRLYGGSGNDDADALIATADGGLLLAGYTTSPAGGDLSQGGPAPWLLKLDAAGAIQWEKAYSSLTATVDRIASLSEYPGGGYVLGSRTAQLSPTSYTPGDFELTRISATGVEQWTKSLGGPDYELLNTVLPLANGSVLAVGTSNSSIGRDKTSASRGGNDIWVLQVAGSSALNVSSQLANVGISLYPNPVNTPLVTLKMNGLGQQAPVQLELLNVLGQSVYTTQAVVYQGAIQQELNLIALPKGVYMLRVHALQGTITKQLLKD
jgi:hypothetical protein